MPGKRNAGGCKCCGGDGEPCTNCTGAAPAEIVATISGWTDDSCDDCTNINGPYSLPQDIYGDTCTYLAAFDNVTNCLIPYTERLTLSVWLAWDFSTYTIRARALLQYEAAPGLWLDMHNVIYERDLGGTKPTCAAAFSGTLAYVSDIGAGGYCGVSSSTMTVSIP